nr:hypothetical protein Ade03nite_94480 [Actinoplanes derwentensis]
MTWCAGSTTGLGWSCPGAGRWNHNPANVMRTVDGRLVVVDLFYADGPNLCASAATDPDLVVARTPEAE